MASRKDKKRQELARLLKARDDLGVPAGLDPWEQAIWVVLRRHGTRDGASRALKALQRRFVDVNEIRAAKGTEIADIIKRNVKNDAYRVARHVRGFLWRFHKDVHSIELSSVDEMTYTELKKYLGDLEEHAQDIALALFLHYCEEERRFEKEREEAEAAGDEKAKKRGERELGQAIDRLRLLCAAAVHGTVPAKTKQATAYRQLAKAWAFSTEPPLARPKPPPPPKIVIEAPDLSSTKRGRKRKTAKKAAAKKASKKAPKKAGKKTAKKSAKKNAKKKTTKKAAKKKTGKAAKKSGGKRGGGTARPRTTRASRARTTKKSSRR